MRFVFYFVPQPVAETFDHIPQFYLDIMDKKNQDDIQRLYVTCKPLIELHDITDESFDKLVKDTTKEFNQYLKKHFGSQFTILETMIGALPVTSIQAQDIIKHVYTQHRYAHETYNQDFFIATHDHLSPNSERTTVRVVPSLLLNLTFVFSPSEKLLEEVEDVDVVLTGQAVLFDEEMFFYVENISSYRLEPEVWRRFVTPRLIEDQINRSIRVSLGKALTGKDIFITNVVIGQEQK